LTTVADFSEAWYLAREDTVDAYRWIAQYHKMSLVGDEPRSATERIIDYQ
jgi:hypothetical protein